ncbi:hypothetical protein [Rhodococcus daqingensis]|uniref:Uncharacterized protein n=1 Tax=Rhodococcus daqingensis TaxID=2479363 RepID=A0ABW2RT59_9NOCA
MIVDCNDCEVRPSACGDCVVTVLLGPPGVRPCAPVAVPAGSARISIEQDERVALEVLAEVGLVPRLRLVRAADATQTGRSLSARDPGVA